MNISRTLPLSVLATGAFLSASLPLQAQQSMNLANEYPASSIHATTADFFAERVEELTNGEIEITNHHGGALGYKSLEQFDAVGDGALELASSSLVFWTGIDPLFQLPSLPFIAPTAADTKALYEAVMPTYKEKMADYGQILLVATPWPSSGLWGHTALDSKEALDGLKVRTYDVSSTETMRNAGAFPVQIGWADVPAQLSTNAIDSVLTSADGGVGIQMWEQLDHFTVVNYAMPMQAIHMNADVFDALDEDEQNAILEAAAEAEAKGWKLLETRSQDNFATMREHGMTVVEEVPAEFSDFLTASAQPFIDEWLESVGDEGRAILDAYEAAREK